jgi:hypothetical protein
MAKNRFWSVIVVGTLALAGGCIGMQDASSSAEGELAYVNQVTFSGQGLIPDGFGGDALVTELCGTANGADADGPYLLWVLTATGAKNADISGPWGTAAMTKTGNGTFKYISGYYAPGTLVGTVSASYDGKVKNAQLVISHGCRPYTHGAWCSPGFWQHAEAGAWALTGHTPADAFNTTVYDVWYGATFSSDPTLSTVLNTTGGTYKGPGVPGSSGYALNAFNATGAMLTDALADFDFDYDLLLAAQGDDSSEQCPIDHFGNLK